MNSSKGNHSSVDDYAKALLDRRTQQKLYPEKEDRTAGMSAIEKLRFEQSQRNARQNLDRDPILLSDIKKEEEIRQAQVRKTPEPKPKPAPNLKKVVEKKKVRWKLPRFFWPILLFILLVGIALAGYIYKVEVWDPKNLTTEEQNEAYKTLVDYADEYEMMSDTEKMELLGLESTYQSLVENQQKKINAYFMEQTGKTFTDLLHEMKTLAGENSEDNASYQALVSFFTSWPDYNAQQQAQILNYRSQYDSLNKTLQNKIDALILEKTGSSFNSIYSEYTLQLAPEPVDVEALQNQVAELSAQLNELQVYGNSLASELEALANAQQDTTQTQAYIDQNNAQMSEIQAQIDELNQTIQENQQ